MRSKASRGEGLVPRWGGGGACRNPRCQLAVPIHDSGISYPGVPVATGMSDCYENDVARFRKCLGIPSIFRIVIPAKAGIQKGWGWGNVVRSKTSRGEGLVPRWGRGGAWLNPPRQLAVPNHNFGFSYLGVPAPAGMSDCCESMSWTPIRDRPLQHPLIGHSRLPFVTPAPQFVIPAKVGIQKRWGGVRPPNHVKNRPVTSFSSSVCLPFVEDTHDFNSGGSQCTPRIIA